MLATGVPRRLLEAPPAIGGARNARARGSPVAGGARRSLRRHHEAAVSLMGTVGASRRQGASPMPKLVSRREGK